MCECVYVSMYVWTYVFVCGSVCVSLFVRTRFYTTYLIRALADLGLSSVMGGSPRGLCDRSAILYVACVCVCVCVCVCARV